METEGAKNAVKAAYKDVAVLPGVVPLKNRAARELTARGDIVAGADNVGHELRSGGLALAVPGERRQARRILFVTSH